MKCPKCGSERAQFKPRCFGSPYFEDANEMCEKCPWFFDCVKDHTEARDCGHEEKVRP